jgi:hypothetical protein
MRRFYLLWAPFCSIWGYLFATFPTSTVERMTGKVAGLFLVCTLTFGLLIFGALLLSSAPPASARLHIDLKPWDEPLGVFQFVFVTFMLVGLWSLALSFALPSARNDLGQFILALSGGGFVGALLASAVYRRAKRARS